MSLQCAKIFFFCFVFVTAWEQLLVTLVEQRFWTHSLQSWIRASYQLPHLFLKTYVLLIFTSHLVMIKNVTPPNTQTGVQSSRRHLWKYRKSVSKSSIEWNQSFSVCMKLFMRFRIFFSRIDKHGGPTNTHKQSTNITLQIQNCYIL